MTKKITVVEINENTTYDDVLNRVVEEEKVEETQAEPAEEEAPLEPPAKPKAKRAPRKKIEAVRNSETISKNEVVEEITPPTGPVRMKRTVSQVVESVEEPVEKAKAKRAPRKKAEVVEETKPATLPVVAPRKSRAAAKLGLYEKLALNALP